MDPRQAPKLAPASAGYQNVLIDDEQPASLGYLPNASGLLVPSRFVTPAITDDDVVQVVGGGDVTSFTAVDRDTIAPAGGTTLTLAVTGASVPPPVTIHGVPCTSVTVVSPTQITCITPALAAGTPFAGPWDITCGSQTLAGAITVGPATTSVFADVDFETPGSFAATLAPLQNDGSTTGKSIGSSGAGDPVKSGGHCLKIVSPSGGGTLYVTYRFANNAALTTNNANGVFLRWYQAYDQAAIDNEWSGGANQFKTHLARYLDSGGGQPGGFMVISGTAAISSIGLVKPQIGCFEDNGVLVIPGSNTHIGKVAGVFNEFQVWYSRDPNTGICAGRLWIDGKLKITRSSSNLLTNTDDALHHLWYQIGVPFSNVAGTTWLDDVKIANGFIDP